MYPKICTIGPFTIYSYGLMLALAFFVSCSLAAAYAKKKGIAPEVIYNLGFLSLIFGVIGARIFYIIENLEIYLENPIEMVMLQHGGLSWFGGLILALCAGVFYLKRRKLSVYKVLDLLAPFLALAQAIGRVGCLLNGCCYGRPSQLIPTQIFASLALLIIFIALRFFQERPHRQGAIIFSYLLLYSFKRFFIEFWRIDNPVILAGLTLFQLISIIIFLISSIKLLQILRTKK